MVTRGSSGSIAPPAPEGLAAPPPFLLIVSITITGILANTLVTAATPDIVESFGVGPVGVGLVLGAATAPGIVLAPLIGVLADRYGRREVIVPCLTIFGFAGGLAAFAPSFPVLVAARLLQGVGSAGLINLAVVLIGDHWDGAERARMIGRNSAALTASIAVLPPLGGLLAGLGGWRLSFVPYWLALGTAVAAARLLPRRPRGTGTLADQVRRAAPYLREQRVLAAIALSFVLFVVIFGVFLTALPVHLDDEFGVGAAGRGLVLAVPAVSSTAVALSIGRLRARYGAGPLLTAGWLLVAAGMAVIAAARSLPVLLLGPVVYGFGEGLMIPTLQDVVAGAAPASSRGSVVAAYVGVARLGQTIGPVSAGIGLEQAPARALFAVASAISGTLAVAQPAVRRLAAHRGESLP